MKTYVIYQNESGGRGTMEKGPWEESQATAVRLTVERRIEEARMGRRPTPVFVPKPPVHVFEAEDWEAAKAYYRTWMSQQETS
jgi:hypothetical protein